MNSFGNITFSKGSSLVLLSLLFFFGCKKGELNPNAAPETSISLEQIHLSGEARLNSTVNLTWYGTDIDGYIDHYEIQINNGDWFETSIQDSTFLFEIDPNSDSTDILFKVRAVDDDGLTDPSPAELIVPLKNSPPIIEFEEESLPVDTTNLVITFRYIASDPDGNSTLQKIFLKANSGTWHEIDINHKLISVIPKNTMSSGSGLAEVYYGIEKTPSGIEIDNYDNNGNNILQLKASDIANSESKVDSTLTIFVRNQTSDLLVVGGHNDGITAQYKTLVTDNYSGADFVNYAGNAGQNQPRFWDPSFRLLSSSYDKVFFHSNEETFSNPLTGADGKLLDFAAPIIQELINDGKKVLVTTAFATGVDLSTMGGVLGIDSLSPSKGQAFFQNDSSATSTIAGYPDVQPSSFLLAMDPVYPSIDAEVFYNAQLTPNGGWYGPRAVGILKRNGNSDINLVVFSLELHRMDKNLTNQNVLISKLLNEAFNW